jgi:hypothetical protein
MAGDNQAAVAAVLARDPRNSVLIKYLESRKWDPPGVSKDFDIPRAD